MRAEAVWQGNLIAGHGTITRVGSGALNDLPITWAARTESSDGKTSPEELLAAARSCYLTNSPLASGTRLGKFELLEELGVGSFGHVFRARDTELDRPVAIKVLRAGRLASQEEVDRFLREARSAAQLVHPGIVSYAGWHRSSWNESLGKCVVRSPSSS